MNRVSPGVIVNLMLVGAILILPGCPLPIRQSAVRGTLFEKGEMAGLPGVRYEVRSEIAEFRQDGVESVYREQAHLVKQGQSAHLPPANFLALSGREDVGGFRCGVSCAAGVKRVPVPNSKPSPAP